MSNRVYAKVTPRLIEALSAAPGLGLVAEGASQSERLEILAAIGYERSLAEARRGAKLEAYRLLAEDEERRAEVLRNSRQALEAGRI